MFTIFFARDPVTDYETAARADTTLYARFFHQMLSQGIYFPPSQFEAAFVSTAHTDKDIQSTIDAAEKAFTSLL
jgi:glutamate-1-semialdehyde 2,1-aminomutase